MNDENPWRDLDRVSFEIVQRVAAEFGIALTALACRDRDLALIQVDALRERALDRLKNWDFEIYALMLSEDQAVQVTRVALAAVEAAFASARSTILESHEILDSPGDEDDEPE